MATYVLGQQLGAEQPAEPLSQVHQPPGLVADDQLEAHGRSQQGAALALQTPCSESHGVVRRRWSNSGRVTVAGPLSASMALSGALAGRQSATSEQAVAMSTHEVIPLPTPLPMQLADCSPCTSTSPTDFVSEVEDIAEWVQRSGAEESAGKYADLNDLDFMFAVLGDSQYHPAGELAVLFCRAEVPSQHQLLVMQAIEVGNDLCLWFDPLDEVPRADIVFCAQPPSVHVRVSRGEPTSRCTMFREVVDYASLEQVARAIMEAKEGSQEPSGSQAPPLPPCVPTSAIEMFRGPVFRLTFVSDYRLRMQGSAAGFEWPFQDPSPSSTGSQLDDGQWTADENSDDEVIAKASRRRGGALQVVDGSSFRQGAARSQGSRARGGLSVRQASRPPWSGATCRHDDEGRQPHATSNDDDDSPRDNNPTKAQEKEWRCQRRRLDETTTHSTGRRRPRRGRRRPQRGRR